MRQTPRRAFSSLLQQMAEGLCRIFKIQGTSILLFDERQRCLFHAGSHGISDDDLARGPVVVNDRRDPVFVEPPASISGPLQNRRDRRPEAAAAKPLKSTLSLPMMRRGAVFGVVRLHHDQPIDLHEEDLDSIRVLGELLGLVLEDMRMRKPVNNVTCRASRLPLHLF